MLHGSALVQNASMKGGPYSEGVYLREAGEGFFGWAKVRDEGGRVQVEFTGRNDLDEVKKSLSFSL